MEDFALMSDESAQAAQEQIIKEALTVMRQRELMEDSMRYVGFVLTTEEEEGKEQDQSFFVGLAGPDLDHAVPVFIKGVERAHIFTMMRTAVRVSCELEEPTRVCVLLESDTKYYVYFSGVKWRKEEINPTLN